MLISCCQRPSCPSLCHLSVELPSVSSEAQTSVSKRGATAVVCALLGLMCLSPSSVQRRLPRAATIKRRDLDQAECYWIVRELHFANEHSSKDYQDACPTFII